MKTRWLRSVLVFFGLWLVSTAALAAVYDFSTPSKRPPCSSWLGWIPSGTTYYCYGSVTLDSGDSIAPATSLTLYVSNEITLPGNNAIGRASAPVNLQTDYGSISVGSGATIYGNLSSSSGQIGVTSSSINGSISTSGPISLSGGNVTGNVSGANGVTMTGATVIGGDVLSTNSAISLSGGSVSGNVSGANGVTTTNGTVITGDVLSSNGSISLSGGNVSGNVSGTNGVTTTNGTVITGNVRASNGRISLVGGSVGSVYSGCCTLTTNGTNILGGVSAVIGSASDTVSITGGTISGAISTSGGSGIFITNATVTSGSITATNVPIQISGSKIGTVSPVNVTATNQITITNSSLVTGNVTVTAGEGTLTIDSSSHVVGTCTPENDGCNSGVVSTCLPPANIPKGVVVSCVCDTFNRSAVNPSTIFGGSWALSNSDGIGDPYINNKRLRLTENTQKNAKAATVPGVFPAAGNYISVEFNHYAYGGSSTPGDGVAVTLSDYSIPVVPGAFGGSLGYAQKSDGSSDCSTVGGCPGFSGGWLGVGLDEFGNFVTGTEGRVGGVTSATPQSIGLRGPGNGQNGYGWISGKINAGSISASGSTPAPGSMYQIIVDSRDSTAGKVAVTVNRDSTNKDGSDYTTLINAVNAYPTAENAKTQGWISKIIPDYWKVSFTGGTGSNTNIHEIDSLRICAQKVTEPTSGVATGFSAIDEAYTGTPPAYSSFLTGNIYMKLAGQPFQLWVGKLTTSNTTPPLSGLDKDYSKSNARYVQVKLVDNSDKVCGEDGARTCNAACTNKGAVESGLAATQIVTFDKGKLTGAALSPSSPRFTLAAAYKELIAVMKECSNKNCSSFTSTAAACSADSFSVRPTIFKEVTSSNANNGASTGTPTIKAGREFALTATTNVGGYLGTPKINGISVDNISTGAVSVVDPATVLGSLSGLFSAATSGSASSTATGAAFKYSEVGAFKLLQPDFSLDLPRLPGVYDDDWTAIDSGPDGDCVPGKSAAAYLNTKTAGKYGCNFGIDSDTNGFGRFIPDHFVVTSSSFVPSCVSGKFSYMGQPFTLSATIEAQNAEGAVTKNYSKSLGLAKATVGVQIENGNNGTAIADTRLAVLGSPVWDSGSYPFVATSFTRLASPDGPYDALDIGLSVADPDALVAATPGPYLLVRDMDASSTTCTEDLTGTLSASGTCTATKITKNTDPPKMRFGRLRLDSAYGSELLNLKLSLQAQYWNGSSWTLNGSDVCTGSSLNVGGVKLSNYSGDWKGNTGQSSDYFDSSHVSIESAESGKWTLNLAKPDSGKTGSVDLCLDLGPDPSGGVICSATTSLNLPWLQGKWYPGSNYDNDPSAKVTFGVYRSLRKLIHRREVF